MPIGGFKVDRGFIMTIMDKIHSEVSIIDYLETYYPDRMPLFSKASGGAFCNCIYHGETKASMRIYPDGHFKCFGCGKHGDLIDIVMQLEQTDFKQACMKVANNCGMPVSFSAGNNAYWESYKDEMYSLCVKYFQCLMNSQKGMSYLIDERNLSLQTINEFGIGLVPDNEYVRRSDIGGISGRISIPILDGYSNKPRCLGMAYRLIENNDKEPKYKNDRNQIGANDQTPQFAGVFIKNENLFGLYQAKSEIKKSGFAFLTEGYFDVMSMHQSGLKNTVAVMGSELSDKQAETLKNITDSVVIMMDNDNAGKRAVINILKKLEFIMIIVKRN